MKLSSLNECSLALTDEDIVQAMEKIPGYLDITPSDFMEIYLAAFPHAMSRLKNAIKAHQIMTQKVITVHEETPLLEVAKKMAVHGISGLPVLKADHTVVGVISDKDFLKQMTDDKAPSFMRIILQCLETKDCITADFKKLNAADIMSSPPKTVGPEMPILEVADTMDRFTINRVPVVDGNLNLLGIIARSDLVKAIC